MKGYISNIEDLAIGNSDFRRVLYTAPNSQLVLMSLKPNEEIGNEVHRVDQFFRFEKGQGKAILNAVKDISGTVSRGDEYEVRDGMVLIVPAGTWHNIINTSKTEPLKLYTLYSPPHHRDGVVHATKTEAEVDMTDEFKGKTTE